MKVEIKFHFDFLAEFYLSNPERSEQLRVSKVAHGVLLVPQSNLYPFEKKEIKFHFDFSFWTFLCTNERRDYLSEAKLILGVVNPFSNKILWRK